MFKRQPITRLTSTPVDQMTEAQRQYLPRLRQLLAEMLPDQASGLIRFHRPLQVEGGTVIGHLQEVSVTTLVDQARNPHTGNRRILSEGRLRASPHPTRPWSIDLEYEHISYQVDLAIGPLSPSPQWYSPGECLPIAAPCDGLLLVRFDCDRITVSVGHWEVDGQTVPMDIFTAGGKDAPSIRVLGHDLYPDDHGYVNFGRVAKGQVVVSFDKPISHQIVRMGIDGKPLLAVEEPLAVPHGSAMACLELADTILESPVGQDVSGALRVYESIDIDLLYHVRYQPVIKDHWLAALMVGKLEGLDRQLSIMCPESDHVTEIAIADGRRVITFGSGRIWTLPSEAVIDPHQLFVGAELQKFDVVGQWCTAAGGPVPVASLIDRDRRAIIASAVNAYGVVADTSELEDADCPQGLAGENIRLLVPVGLLGDLADKDQDGKPHLYIGVSQDTAVEGSANRYRLPRVGYDRTWQIGPHRMRMLIDDTLRPTKPDSEKPGKGKGRKQPRRRHANA